MKLPFIEIDTEFFKEIINSQKVDHSVNMTYIDKNPIIRWLWWKRLKMMLSLSKIDNSKKVLDFGCGEGVFLPTLAANYQNVHAVDLDIKIAKTVKEHYKLENVKIFNDNIFKTNLKDNNYDIIFSASVLEHFQDVEYVLKVLRNKLKENGVLIFSSPTENYIYKIGRILTGYDKYQDPLDIHYFGSSEIAEEAKKYFDLVKRYDIPFNIKIFPLHSVYLFLKKKSD